MKSAVPSTAIVIAPEISLGDGGGAPLCAKAQEALVRAVIDLHMRLPGMFEITFLDQTGALLSDAGISIGTRMRLKGHSADDDVSRLLIDGEVTSLEANCRDLTSYAIVRGYDLCHRLQRTRRTRTFPNRSDSEIAGLIADAAGFNRLDRDIERSEEHTSELQSQ